VCPPNCPLCAQLGFLTSQYVPSSHVIDYFGKISYVPCSGLGCSICNGVYTSAAGGAGGAGSAGGNGGNTTYYSSGANSIAGGGGGGGSSSAVLPPGQAAIGSGWNTLMGPPDPYFVTEPPLPVRQSDTCVKAWKIARINITPLVPKGIGFWPMFHNVPYTAERNVFQCDCAADARIGYYAYGGTVTGIPHEHIDRDNGRCGWYGMKSLELLLKETQRCESNFSGDPRLWVLECEFYGRTISAATGYRAEKQRVLSIRPLLRSTDQGPRFPFMLSIPGSVSAKEGQSMLGPADLAAKLGCEVSGEPLFYEEGK
jgi:hypothetical protein